MNFGFDKEIWEKTGISVVVNLDPTVYTHVLLTGGSGSGKSYSLLYLLKQYVKEHIELWLCDFKNSTDFAFLNGYQHYYTGDDAIEGILSYYKKFTEVRRSGETATHYILIVDEYPSMINYLSTKDKLEKTKVANEVMGAISEILMLGRGIKFGCLITTQRADSSLFANGSRDNFQCVIGLGRMSKEQKTMVFTGEDIPMELVFQRGEGYLLADGKEIMQVKYPLIKDIEMWKTEIVVELNKNNSDESIENIKS